MFREIKVELNVFSKKALVNPTNSSGIEMDPSKLFLIWSSDLGLWGRELGPVNHPTLTRHEIQVALLKA